MFILPVHASYRRCEVPFEAVTHETIPEGDNKAGTVAWTAPDNQRNSHGKPVMAW